MLADIDDNQIELTNAKYYTDIMGNENEGIYISWNGNVITVPINEKNSDYKFIKSRVDAGTLTIADAD